MLLISLIKWLGIRYNSTFQRLPPGAGGAVARDGSHSPAIGLASHIARALRMSPHTLSM